jgi:hypothetical protein
MAAFSLQIRQSLPPPCDYLYPTIGIVLAAIVAGGSFRRISVIYRANNYKDTKP